MMARDISELLLRCARRLLDAPKTPVVIQCLIDINQTFENVDSERFLSKDDEKTLKAVKKYVSTPTQSF